MQITERSHLISDIQNIVETIQCALYFRNKCCYCLDDYLSINNSGLQAAED